MNKKRILVAMCVIVSMCVASCSGGKTKGHDAKQDKPAQSVVEQQGGGGTDAPAENSAVRRTPAQLLAAIPCKMQNKKGVFAVFPDNSVAGQICFKLNPANGTEQSIPTFNIQSGGMYIVFHDNSGITPGEASLMKWAVRNGSSCLETDCGKAIASRSETYAAPDEPGWNYLIITPEKSVDFSSSSEGDIGLVVGAEKYLPLFQ